MRQFWFVSDCHFDHKNIMKYCQQSRGQYIDINDMNDHIVENWNKYIRKDDVVYFLGDWAMHAKSRDKYIHKLNGFIHWIVGNHDKGIHAAKIANQNIVYIGDVLLQCINNKNYLLVHSPYKYKEYLSEIEPHLHDKLRIVCGHVHDKWKVQPKGLTVGSYLTNNNNHNEQSFVTDHTIVNVGLDVWNMKPVCLEELEMIFERSE